MNLSRQSVSLQSVPRHAWARIGLAIYAVSTLISMAVMSAGVAFGLLGIVLAVSASPGGWPEVWKRAWGSQSFRTLGRLSVALALALALSLIAAMIWPPGYGDQFVKVSLGKDMAKGWYLFWPFLLAIGLRALGPEDRAFCLRAWLLALGALGFIGFLQHWTGWPRPQIIPMSRPERFHATLFLGHHLSVASILIFPVFAALDLARDRRGFGVLPRWLLLSFAGFGAATLILGYSRTLWVALPVGLALWLILSLPRKRAWALVAALGIAGVGAFQIPQVRERALSSMGTGERWELWRNNWQIFSSRPLTGAGWHHNLELGAYYAAWKNPGRHDYFASHAHNNVLEALGGTGVLGLLAWLAWNLGWLAIVIRLLKDSSASAFFARGLLCAWVVFQINGLTQVNFWESKVLHQLMWVSAWLLLWAMEKEVGLGREERA